MWRWMGKEVQWSETYFGTILLPLLRGPISDPPVPKLRFAASPHWHYVFSGFSQIGRFWNTQLGAAQQIHFGLFSKTLILSFVWQFWSWTCKETIFPAVLGVFALRLKMRATHTPMEPTRRCNTPKKKKKVLNCFIFCMMPQDDVSYFAHPLRELVRCWTPRNTVEKGVSWHRTLCAPFLNASTGAFSNN